ncbi:MAG: hypothetical protein ACO294_12600 [Methylococcales bacterium]
MNERIKELAEQAGISLYKKDILDKHYPELYDGVYCESSVEQLEKFAELIIDICRNIAEDGFYEEIDGQEINDKIARYFRAKR